MSYIDNSKIMTIYRRWSTSLSSAMWLVFAMAVWAIFAPIPMGGNAAYIIVNGISMEPNFHRGDLVIVSPSSQYSIGDAVVYRNQGLGGKNVFHRIIELNIDRYILKGDNNSWIDTYQPASEEVIGKAVDSHSARWTVPGKSSHPAWNGLARRRIGAFPGHKLLP